MPTTVETFVRRHLALIRASYRRRDDRNDVGAENVPAAVDAREPTSHSKFDRRRGAKEIPATYAAQARLSPQRTAAARGQARVDRFDVADALALHLANYPTKRAMLILLQAWIYGAEKEGLAAHQPAYLDALLVARSVLSKAESPEHAIELLRQH